MNRRIRLVYVAVAALLLTSCGKKLTDPTPTTIDGAINFYPAAVTSQSDKTPTPNGSTKNWAGLPPPGLPAHDNASDPDTTIIDGVIWSCSEHDRSYSEQLESFPLLDGNTDVVWPGSALQGRSLYRATPDPITAPRGPGVLIWADYSEKRPLSSSVAIPATTHAEVKWAADSLLAAQSSPPPTQLLVSMQQTRTQEDLQIAVKASSSWFGLWGASASFHMDTDVRHNYFLLTLKQRLFTLIYQRPALPHEFFASGVVLSDIAPYIGPDNPPAYVSSVGYGRVIYILVRSSEDAREVRTTLDANFNVGVFGTDIGGKVDYVTNLKDLQIQYYVYGGARTGIQGAVTGGLDGLKRFLDELKQGSDYKLALPVSATIRSVASDELLQNGFNIAYTYRECTPYALCSPTLLLPGPNEAGIDNGCRCDSNPVQWNFAWSPCPEASEYQLEVEHPEYGSIFASTVASNYRLEWPSPLLTTTDWRWRVRAKFGASWGPWADYRDFKLEGVDSDCKTGVTLYSGTNYTGTRVQFVDAGDAATLNDLRRIGMNDAVGSFKLHNRKSITLYTHLSAEGTHATFDETSCPDVQLHRNHGWPRNVTTSLRMTACPRTAPIVARR